MSDTDFDSIFPLGEKNDAYAQYFIGQSYLSPLTSGGVVVSNVTFEPGCRNNWHVHHASSGGGQVLLATAGSGWYQAEGEDPISLEPGMVVQVPAGRKHWHGAKADSWFSHLAFIAPGEDLSNEWLEPVADSVYGLLPAAGRDAGHDQQHDRSEDHQAPVTAGRDALGEFAPLFAELNDDVLFGRVWSREQQLSARDRSMITVTALLSGGILDTSLLHHLERAKANGVRAEEIAEVLTQAAFYAGWPKAWAAFRLAKEIYTD